MTDLIATHPRTTPWDGLGTKFQTPVKTAREAIIDGGLDWTVEPRSIFVSLPGGDKRQKISGRKAIVRSSDNAVLGLVSDLYQTFQNVEAFEFADSIVDSGEAKYESTFQMRHGKVIGLTMRVPDHIMVGGEDAHDLYIVLRTSHDGSKAISVYVTPIRVRCMNQMAIATSRAKHRWSMQHTTRLQGKLQEARETLKLSFKYSEEFAKIGEELMGVKVTDDQFHDIIEDLLPDRPRTEEVIDSIMGLYRESPTNGYTGTAWGGMNAITEYFDHGRKTRSQEAEFNAIMDGGIAILRTKAANRLLELR